MILLLLKKGTVLSFIEGYTDHLHSPQLPH